jgi:hypothetical protein
MSIFDSIRSKLSIARDSDSEPEMETAADQSSDEQQLAAFVKKKFETVRQQSNRIAAESVWMANIAALMGFDQVFWNTTTRAYQPTDNTQKYLKRNRLHSNQLLPAVQNRLARLCKVPPRFEVRPESMDQEDKEAARLALDLAINQWDDLGMPMKRIELLMWVQQCGHAFLKISHDDQLGEPLIDPVDDTLVGYEGQVRVDVVNALEAFPDPLAKNMDELTFMGQAKVRKLDYFKTQFPDRGHMVKEEGPWLLSTQYELRINSLNSGQNGAVGGTTQQMENAAIELNYYEKRSLKHPRGRHIIVANGVVLKDDELPVGEIPFVKFDDALIGGKFYSEALLTHARPLQEQYNKVISKRAQWTDKMLAGKYLAEKRHGIIKEGLDDSSGEVVEYDNVPGAPPPGDMPIPVIPAYAYEETKWIKEDLFDIMGLSEVARGNLPAAGIPAVGMQLLLEQDETRIGIETETHEHGYARTMQLVLMHIARFYKSERKLKTKGKNLETIIQKFTGDDIPFKPDIKCIRGSTMPTSRSMRRQELLNLAGQGLLGDLHDPSVREKLLGELEFGELNEVYEDYATKCSQVSKTIKQIENNIIPEVNKMDPHELHIQRKNMYRMSDKWDTLTPQQQQVMLADIQRHVMQLTLLLNPALANPPPGLGAPPPQPQPTLAMPPNPMQNTGGGAVPPLQ